MTETTKAPSALRSKFTETTENVADMGHLAKEAVQDKMHDFADRASVNYDGAKHKLHAMEQSLADRIKESPMKSLLIAAGAGLLLGFLVRRA